MGKTIGIDLGTTNSCVAVMEGGEPVIIPNSEGHRTTPSIVAFTQDGQKLVGVQAKNQMITNPENTVRSIKRFIGRRYDEVQSEIKTIPYEVIKGSNGDARVKTVQGEFSAPEISARVLQKMKQTAEDYLGQPVKEAVITVPAYFNLSQKEATKDAGKIAGLEVKRIINEPTAAALAYGLDKTKKQGKIAVFDLGGGTFDISILEISDGVFEVKSTNGDTHLGGDDFDQVIIDYLSDEFRRQYGINLKEDKMALQRLKEAAERAKIELSGSANTNVNLPFITADQGGPKHLNINLSRAKLEQLIEPLVERTKQPCYDALKDAGISKEEIDEILLVGGSTRIPKVQEVVQQLFGKTPSKNINPDEAVAIGAAIQAGVLSGDVKDVLLLDVIPMSMGIETLGGVFTKMIERNTTIPTKKTEVFSTAEDNQSTVSIMVYQGERPMARDNRLIGQFNLDGIPPAPRGIPQIEVTFDVDANGILNVSAKDRSTQKQQSIRIEASSGLSQEEIDRMVKEAEANADRDKKAKEEAETFNQADNLAYTMEKLLRESGDKIPEAERSEVEREIENVKQAIQSKDVQKVQEAKTKLEQTSHKISQVLYQQQGAQAGPGPEYQQSEQANTQSNAEEDVVDAEYTVSNDNK